MDLFDTIELNDADLRITARGYLTCTPRVARTGIQLYTGDELGAEAFKGKVVKVYRPEAEVFKMDAWAGMAHKPITNDHPPVMVDSSNWKQFAVGQSGDQVARDGDSIRVPMVIMDGATIAQVRKGKRQLSVGYTCDVKFEAGQTPSGEAYDAIQTNITPNHIAVVKAARGGATLTIGDADKAHVSGNEYANALNAIMDGKISRDAFDASEANLVLAIYPVGHDGVVFVDGLTAAKEAATADKATTVVAAVDALLKVIDSAKPQEEHGMNDKTLVGVTFDGITIMMTAQDAQIAQRAMAARDADIARFKKEKEEEEEKGKKAAKDSGDQLATLTTQVSTKDAEITTLKQQLKDAEITPAKLDQLVKDRAEVAVKAKAMIGDALVVDGKTESDMRKQVVIAKIGDAAKDWNDSQIAASFATLTAGVTGINSATGIADMQRAFGGQPAVTTFDSAGGDKRVNDSYDAYDKRLTNAWQNQPQTKQ